MERNDTYFSDFRIVFYRLYILEEQKREKKDFKSRLAHQKRGNPNRISPFLVPRLRRGRIRCAQTRKRTPVPSRALPMQT